MIMVDMVVVHICNRVSLIAKYQKVNLIYAYSSKDRIGDYESSDKGSNPFMHIEYYNIHFGIDK